MCRYMIKYIIDIKFHNLLGIKIQSWELEGHGPTTGADSVVSYSQAIFKVRKKTVIWVHPLDIKTSLW